MLYLPIGAALRKISLLMPESMLIGYRFPFYGGYVTAVIIEKPSVTSRYTKN